MSQPLARTCVFDLDNVGYWHIGVTYPRYLQNYQHFVHYQQGETLVRSASLIVDEKHRERLTRGQLIAYANPRK